MSYRTIWHMNALWLLILFVCLEALEFGCSGVYDEEQYFPPIEYQDKAITDGTNDPKHQSVGFVVVGGTSSCTGDIHGKICTGTLVGNKTVLTAGHCIFPEETNTFCLEGKIYQVESVIAHPAYDGSQLNHPNDIGLLFLSKSPLTTPSLISSTSPQAGTKIALVGYGSTSEEEPDSGTRRIAYNTIKAVSNTRFSVAETGGGVGNTCKGDSGGPAFATINNKERQVGVTSMGIMPCGTLGYNTRVDVYYNWLVSTSKGDLHSADQIKPSVTITSPADNAKVDQSVIVKATVSDNFVVKDVTFQLDGVEQGTLEKAPYEHLITLDYRQHIIKVIARDEMGNQGESSVKVNMPPDQEPKLEFGSKCTDSSRCISNICGTFEAQSYCSITCNPVENSCPQNSDCQMIGNRYLCEPRFDNNDQQGLAGGCNTSPRDPSQLSWIVLMLFLSAGILFVRRGAYSSSPQNSG